MNDDPAISNRANPKASPSRTVLLSRWVNERCPPLAEILSAHDVARLTRRPCWLLLGLSLIGQFPKKMKVRGRPVGWCRSEVLAWMSRDLVLEPERKAPRRCGRRHPYQQCLPLNCPARRHFN
jgi:hypothetical protein